jgi:hypothetical protein
MLNMSPLKATGVRLNQANRIWEAPPYTPQVVRKPAEIFEFNELTVVRHCSLLGSNPIAIEMAAVLMPAAMSIVTGITTVSPTLPVAEPIVVRILADPEDIIVICPVVFGLLLWAAMVLLG